MVSSGAGFDADQARWQLSEERKKLWPSNLLPDHNDAALVDAGEPGTPSSQCPTQL
jgi:hypothetical protein